MTGTESQTISDVLIVGAGISGLSLAQALAQSPQTASSPYRVLVAEQQDRVGGNITTNRADGFLWEEGPTSFAPNPAILKLAIDVGLKSEIVLADRRLPRFVYWQGALHAIPMSPPAIANFRLLSDRGKLRAFLGALGFVSPAIGTRLAQQGGEETVDQFFRRHLGAEVTERLVAPFVSGVYAGDPKQLSASSAFARVTQMADLGGGLLAGAILSRRQSPKAPLDPEIPKTKAGELGSFKEGLTALPKAIASHLGDRVKLRWSLKDLRQTDRQTYLAEFSTPDGMQQIEARSVVLTSPAYITAEILKPLDFGISDSLNAIPYPPVACVVLAYPQSALQRPLNGFGNLIPREQGIRTLGTIWSSSLFPGRAPQGWQSLTSFIGGATDEAIAQLSEAQIAEAVHQDLSHILLQPNAPQPKVLAVHLWKRAIPQYTLGHHQRLQQIEMGLKHLPGLYVCGNYIDGVALGDCVRRAQQKAQQVAQYLQT